MLPRGFCDDPDSGLWRDAVRGKDASAVGDSLPVRLDVFCRQIRPVARNVPVQQCGRVHGVGRKRSLSAGRDVDVAEAK